MNDEQESNIADIDFSVIRTAIEIGGKTIEQILNGVHYGSPEVRCLLLDECDLIIECKVCRALFRALPNFVAHKRVYCTKSFQETQPPLFETTVTDETIVVEPTCPEDDSTCQPSVAATPEESLNNLVEQIHAGKAGMSDEYKFYSNVAGMVERRKEMGKTTSLELKAIPSNPNAVMVNVTEGICPDQKQDLADVNEKNEDVTSPVSRGSSRLETLLIQKILPKSKSESILKSKCDVTKDNAAKTKIPPEMTVLPASKDDVVVDANEKQSESVTTSAEKVESSKSLKSVAKQPAASRVSLREKKPTVKSRVNDVAETNDTLDLSSLKCLKCHMSYSSRKTLLYHYQMRHSQLRTFFPCPFCSNIFFYFWGLTRHLMKIHSKTKNQIDKMREKLRKRSFTKSITKSCNIAKDQLQFVADNEEEALLMEMSANGGLSTSKSSKQMPNPNPSPNVKQITNSKNSGTSKSGVGSVLKQVKGTYSNEYEIPKFHKQPRISLKEGLRNSKNKNANSKKAVVKRMSESPQARNASWAEVNKSKSGRSRKSEPSACKSVSDEEPSPKSKERALNELQKKLTEAAAAPIATRSSSNERSNSRSSSSDSAAIIRGSETKIPGESPESRQKQTETVSSSPVLERRRIVSGSSQVSENKRRSSEMSPDLENKYSSSVPKNISSESSRTAKEEAILGFNSSEPKSSLDRPGARRRQIQIGTTFVPRVGEKALPLVKTEMKVAIKQKDCNDTESSKMESSDTSVSNGKKDGLERSSEKVAQDTKLPEVDITVRDSDEIRGRSTRRRTLPNKFTSSVGESFKNNESNAKTTDNIDKQDNKTESKDKQAKKPESIDKEERKQVVDDQENVVDKSYKQKKNVTDRSKTANDVSEVFNTENLKFQTRSTSKDKMQKNIDASVVETGTSQSQDQPTKTGSAEKSHPQSDRSSNNISSVSEIESGIQTSQKFEHFREPELYRKASSSRSSSVERLQTFKESNTDSRVSPKEAKIVERKDAGESTMRLFASPPGSKPLIKHSRIKKTNEFVVRCVPPSASPIAKSDAVQHLPPDVSAIEKSDDKMEADSLEISSVEKLDDNAAEKEKVADCSNDSITNDTNSLTDKVMEAEIDTSINDAETKEGFEDGKSSGKTVSKDRFFCYSCNRQFNCKAGFLSHKRSCKDHCDQSETSYKLKEKMETTSAEQTQPEAFGNKSDGCSVISCIDNDTSKKKEFICHCGREFDSKVGLSNHQRACTNDSENHPEKKQKKDVNSNQGDRKDSITKSVFSVQSSFELFSCEKCNRVFGRKVSFLNHQQNCTEKKSDTADHCDKAFNKDGNSDKLSDKGDNSGSIKKDVTVKTSSTRRKFVARKLAESRNDFQDSDVEQSTISSNSNQNDTHTNKKQTMNDEQSNSYSESHRKRCNTARSEVDREVNDPPEKQMRVIEEIWVNKVPGKPVERVKSNRTYVMAMEGSGKLHCQDTKKLCDIADEVDIKCLVCLQEFTSISNLRRHAIRHLGWKRYKCKMCRFSSYNKSECNTHIIRTHSDKLRSAAATEKMIVDLNKEACKVRTQKKKKTLKERKATEMGKTPPAREHRSKQNRYEKQTEKAPEDRKKPAVREENIQDINLHSTFNISTRNSPRKFDTRPYRKVDHMSTLCTRKSYYLKTNQQGELNKDNKHSGSPNNTAQLEVSPEKQEESPGKKNKNLSSSHEKVDKTKDVENVHEDDATEKGRKLDNLESMSDTESSSQSKEKMRRKHRSSSEHKDIGYSSDSCLSSHQSPSKGHSKTKSVSSDSSVHKHRKLSGGSSSSEKNSTVHSAGVRPVTMMSIQDMFELIKPKPKPERKSVGETPVKSAVKTTSQTDPVRRVSLEGAVVTRKQSVSGVSQISCDKERTGELKETSTKGDNEDLSNKATKTGSPAV